MYQTTPLQLELFEILKINNATSIQMCEWEIKSLDKQIEDASK
jgi:hypothetical protein